MIDTANMKYFDFRSDEYNKDQTGTLIIPEGIEFLKDWYDFADGAIDDDQELLEAYDDFMTLSNIRK